MQELQGLKQILKQLQLLVGRLGLIETLLMKRLIHLGDLLLILILILLLIRRRSLKSHLGKLHRLLHDFLQAKAIVRFSSWVVQNTIKWHHWIIHVSLLCLIEWVNSHDIILQIVILESLAKLLSRSLERIVASSEIRKILLHRRHHLKWLIHRPSHLTTKII